MKDGKQLNYKFKYRLVIDNPFIEWDYWALTQMYMMKKGKVWLDWLATYCMGEEL